MLRGPIWLLDLTWYPPFHNLRRHVHVTSALEMSLARMPPRSLATSAARAKAQSAHKHRNAAADELVMLIS
jgi:hypothetical protein